MNVSLLLFVSSTLTVIWVIAVVVVSSTQKRWETPNLLQNPRTLKILNPVFYVLFVGIAGFYLALPLLAGGLMAAIWSLPMIVVIYLITYRSEFGKVRMTEIGKALCVATFSLLIVAILPLGYLVFYWATN